MAFVTALIAGLLFGSGLLLSRMYDPQRVLGFLDVAGHWNPALAFTMTGAVAVAHTDMDPDTLAALRTIARDRKLDLRTVGENGEQFRRGMSAAGFTLVPGQHPIVPVMLGDAALATRMADALLAKGIYVVGFSYPVVPQGKARIRVQISAAHTEEELRFAAEQFIACRQQLGL